jgi:hypothetical protein
MAGRFFAFLIFMLLGFHPAIAGPICGIKFTSPQQVEKEVRKQKKTVKLKSNDYLNLYSDAGGTIGWIFTTKKSAAYPAAVCRWPVLQKGEMKIFTDIRCGGTEAACDALANEYRKRDEQFEALVKKNLAKKKKKSP